MKKHLLVCLILLYSINQINAQIYTPSGTVQGSSGNNNVGIGIANPGTNLEVNGVTTLGKTYQNILKIGPLDSAPAYFYIDTKIPFNDSPAPQVQITGYNYSNPNKAIKLTLSWYTYNNSFYWMQYKSDLGYYNPSSIRLGTYNDAGTTRVRIEIANDGTYWSGYFISATDHNGASINYNGWSFTLSKMPAETGNINNVSEYAGIIYNNAGNILIGKNTQTNLTYKLDVAGKIRADEILVNSTGADFVFGSDYKLLPIKELNEYIIKNNHLPDFESASEMHNVGIGIGEMQIKLLQKIEELTLYSIEQNKRIEELMIYSVDQNKRLNEQSKKIESLEKSTFNLDSK